VGKEIELKTWPEAFDGVWDGRKPYEIRKDDRGAEVGDVLRLREFDPNISIYSGREVTAEVTYKTKGGEWGIPIGLCVLGIKRIGWRSPKGTGYFTADGDYVRN